MFYEKRDDQAFFPNVIVLRDSHPTGYTHQTPVHYGIWSISKNNHAFDILRIER